VLVDALMLLGENRFGPTLEVPEALALCKGLGIDKLVAAPARPLDYHLEPANARLAAAARASGAWRRSAEWTPSTGRQRRWRRGAAWTTSAALGSSCTPGDVPDLPVVLTS
jgi:hypothetical protein